jgi:iron-sulfur cluster assembly protein
MTETVPVKITDRAATRLKSLLSSADAAVLGIRIGVSTQGCSGLSYTMDFAKEAADGDSVVEQDGVTILLDPEASPYIEGTEIDWEEDSLASRFVFRNPREKGRCGCGESFHI